MVVPDLDLGREGFVVNWGILIGDQGGAVIVGGGLVRLVGVLTRASSWDWRWGVLLCLRLEGPAWTRDLAAGAYDSGYRLEDLVRTYSQHSQLTFLIHTPEHVEITYPSRSRNTPMSCINSSCR